MGIVSVVLFGAAFLTSVWTLIASIRPQLHRYRALLAPAPARADLPLRATRITVRWSAPQQAARTPRRAAA